MRGSSWLILICGVEVENVPERRCEERRDLGLVGMAVELFRGYRLFVIQGSRRHRVCLMIMSGTILALVASVRSNISQHPSYSMVKSNGTYVEI